MAQWQKSVPTIDPAGTWLIVCPLGDSGDPKGPMRPVHATSAQEFVAEKQLFWSAPVELPPWPEGFGSSDEPEGTDSDLPVNDGGPGEEIAAMPEAAYPAGAQPVPGADATEQEGE